MAHLETSEIMEDCLTEDCLKVDCQIELLQIYSSKLNAVVGDTCPIHTLCGAVSTLTFITSMPELVGCLQTDEFCELVKLLEIKIKKPDENQMKEIGFTKEEVRLVKDIRQRFNDMHKKLRSTIGCRETTRTRKRSSEVQTAACHEQDI